METTVASISTRIIRRSRILTLAQKYVWERIYELSRRPEGCTLSARALAEDLGMEERTIRRCRMKLQHYGLLTRDGLTGRPASWKATLDQDYTPAEHQLARAIFRDCTTRLDAILERVSGGERSRAYVPKPRATGPTLVGPEDRGVGPQVRKGRS